MTIAEQIKEPAVGKYTNGKTNIWNLSPDISVKGDKLLHKGKAEFGRIDECSRTITVVRRRALESFGRRNPLLSHTALVPDVTYKITDGENYHEFNTDNLGRTIKTYHKPKAIYRQRLNSEQTKALMCKDEDTKPHTPKHINDEGGHILADSAGGLPESINIFPQAYCVNHSSKWRSMETSIKNAVSRGISVCVETKFTYHSNCKRPDSYTYKINIGGNITLHEFNNINNSI